METFVDRFADAPVRHVPPDALTAVDQKILAVLRRYRLLDVPYLAALTGTPYRYLHERLKILRASNNRYVNIVEVQRINREAYRMRPLYFELGVNGGHPEYTGTVKRLDHKAMEQHIFAEFEIGTLKHPYFELIPRAEVLKHCHPETQDADYPEAIPLSSGRRLWLDGHMFVLRAKENFHFFPGVEAETGSNRIKKSRTNPSQSSVEQKFEDNVDVIINHIYKSHFGTQSIYFPYFCTPHVDIDLMIHTWTRVSESHPQTRNHVWFKVYTPRPTSQMVEEPFIRLAANGAREDFNLGGVNV
jgi:hypothetical protein